MFTKKILILSLTTLATFATIGATAGCSADLSDDMAGPAPTPAATTHVGPLKETARDVAPGGSASQDGQPSGKQADKATQVHMSIVNSTSQVLNLTSATSSGKGNHWQDRPTTLQPGQQQMVSNYAAGDAEINLTYTGAGDGVVFTLHGETPLTGSNQASGSTNSTSYTVNAQAASGYNPTFNYYMQSGHAFGYTGATDTFTVPAGVSSMKVTVVGGTGGDAGDYKGAGGAQISGTLAVTAGEKFTVGVGGSGNDGDDKSDYLGGWGMSYGDSTFAGGNGISGGLPSAGGGGATAIQDPTGQLVVVAGGGGGWGGGGGDINSTPAYIGGQGGAGGSLTGGNGAPGPNSGGAPGANSVSRGQDGQGGGENAGGAGGGGLKGGMGGIGGTGGGGGAGSSFDGGLTNPTVSVGSNSTSGVGQNGTVIFSPAN